MGNTGKVVRAVVEELVHQAPEAVDLLVKMAEANEKKDPEQVVRDARKALRMGLAALRASVESDIEEGKH